MVLPSKIWGGTVNVHFQPSQGDTPNSPNMKNTNTESHRYRTHLETEMEPPFQTYPEKSGSPSHDFLWLGIDGPAKLVVFMLYVLSNHYSSQVFKYHKKWSLYIIQIYPNLPKS